MGLEKEGEHFEEITWRYEHLYSFYNMPLVYNYNTQL